MEDDFKADRNWWEEVESSIRADAVSDSITSTTLEVDEAGNKRELEMIRCTGDAKRIKRPG